MFAKDLIGKLAMRTAPTTNNYIFFMADIIKIIHADDDVIAYVYTEFPWNDGKIRYLSKDYCDNNWKLMDYFVSIAESNNLQSYIKEIREIYE